MKYYDIEQNTDEWLELRSGMVTASSLKDVMANFGKAFGPPAKTLAVKIAIEQITGEHQSSNYSNDHMERGHEEEPLARQLYEQEYFVDVKNGGFFTDDIMGCSPDGLINDDGLIEIKSGLAHIHYERVRKQAIDSGYKWQCVSAMKVTGREWIDFVSYCSSFPIEKRLFVFRLFAADCEKEYEMIDSRVKEFIELVETTKQTIEVSKYRTK